jgi:hypothetical protein
VKFLHVLDGLCRRECYWLLDAFIAQLVLQTLHSLGSAKNVR